MNIKPKWAPLRSTQLALDEHNRWVLAITAWVPGEVEKVISPTWYWKPRHTKTSEELNTEMIHELEGLKKILWPALERYKELFWKDFLLIEQALENIQSLSTDSITVKPRNIQILSLFSIVGVYDKKAQLEFFGLLLNKLKYFKHNIIMQAHILWLINLLRTHVIDKKYNIPVIDWSKDNAPNEDKIKLQKLYELMLKNIFDLFQYRNAIYIDNVSKQLHDDIKKRRLIWEDIYNRLKALFGEPVFKR